MSHEHHSRKWPIRNHSGTDSNEQSNGKVKRTEPPQKTVKRAKKDRNQKSALWSSYFELISLCSLALPPRSSPSPEPLRSPYEREAVGMEPQAQPPRRPQPPMFEIKNGRPTVLPNDAGKKPAIVFALTSFAGPVIPRSPPDSAFTRNAGTRRNNEAVHGTAMAPNCGSPILDPSVLDQFYVTNSVNNVSSSFGATELFAPLQTPFGMRLDELLPRQAHLQYKADGSENPVRVHGVELQPTTTTQVINRSPFSTTKTQMDARLIAENSEHFVMSMPPNRLSCSIESLPSRCKTAICEVQHIQQMENACGYSKQDFPFEACMVGQTKRQVCSKPAQPPEGTYMMPVDASASQIQAQETLQQLSTHPGILPYGIVLVPIDQQHNFGQPNNGPR